MKASPFIWLSVIALPLILFSCTETQEKSYAPNIIIIFADDLGYGDLSSYGHPLIETPNIDRLGEEGIRFTSFYAAASVCTPSRAALLTGRYPIRNSPFNFGPESENGLPLDEITLAEILKDKGYRTGMVGKWHLGHHEPYLPTNRGFDSYYGLPYSNDMILPWCPWLSEDDRLFMYEGLEPTREVGFNQGELTLDYTEKAVEFIKGNSKESFFLYFAHSMPHLPISTSEEFLGKSKAGLYGDVIETMDWSTGRILDVLDELGISDKTIVIFTSDNGPWQNLPERMLQRGVERWHSGSAGLLRGAKATTYEGGLRVPALIRWPNMIPAGQVSSELTNTMDLFTTLIHFAGAKVPTDRPIDGKNIENLLLTSEPIDEPRNFYYLNTNRLEAVRKGRWKLRIAQDSIPELYDLSSDPSEKYDLSESNPGKVGELLFEMIKFAKETSAEGSFTK